MKKLLAFLLAFCLVGSALSFGTAYADNAKKSFVFGDTTFNA